MTLNWAISARGATMTDKERAHSLANRVQYMMYLLFEAADALAGVPGMEKLANECREAAEGEGDE